MNTTNTRDIAIPASQLINSSSDKSAYWLLALVLMIYGAFAVVGVAGTTVVAGS